MSQLRTPPGFYALDGAGCHFGIRKQSVLLAIERGMPRLNSVLLENSPAYAISRHMVSDVALVRKTFDMAVRMWRLVDT